MFTSLPLVARRVTHLCWVAGYAWSQAAAAKESIPYVCVNMSRIGMNTCKLSACAMHLLLLQKSSAVCWCLHVWCTGSLSTRCYFVSSKLKLVGHLDIHPQQLRCATQYLWFLCLPHIRLVQMEWPSLLPGSCLSLPRCCSCRHCRWPMQCARLTSQVH